VVAGSSKENRAARKGEPVEPSVAAVVVAAGRGLRAGSVLPKQYRLLGGEPAIRRTLIRFAEHPSLDAVQTVIHANDAAHYAKAARGLALLEPVIGGATRQHSVLAGLEALLARAPDIVLVHDAARPFVSPALINRAIVAARPTGAAVPALAVNDTVKRIDSVGLVAETINRDALRFVQTPQAFDYAALLAAHRRAKHEGRQDFTDDAALAEWAGMKVAVFEGEPGNLKLTTREDFCRAEALEVIARGDVRTGTGYDVHAFGAGDHVMIGGVRIAHGRGLIGHSDADVALHALTDAILGALAEGDIGEHFPPNDPQWRGVSSDRFLAFAAQCVRARDGLISNVDVTIICEAPRIAPYRGPIRDRIATIAGLELARVAVKATTSEKLGFTGRGEGIAAIATATIRLPLSAS
jgi:2-C-methyl-D-erythritol 4-phosphate cytidylyltransferase / 2-C-methyl-D-erythritol 2,4-cyclodiphosphate synthase